jgi:hypothetical protein
MKGARTVRGDIGGAEDRTVGRRTGDSGGG